MTDRPCVNDEARQIRQALQRALRAGKRIPGPRLHLQTAMRDSDRHGEGGRMSATEQDRERARDLWRELGKADCAQATPEQLLAFLRQCPEPVGLDYAGRMLAALVASTKCFQADHDALVDEVRFLRIELADARRQLDATSYAEDLT